MNGDIPHDILQGYWGYQRRLARGGFTVAVAAGLVIYGLGYAAVAKGLVLGALFSVLNLVIMAHVLPYLVRAGITKKKATSVAMLSFTVRLGVIAIPLLVAMKSRNFQFWGVVVGLFTVQAAVFADHILARPWRGARSSEGEGY